MDNINFIHTLIHARTYTHTPLSFLCKGLFNLLRCFGAYHCLQAPYQSQRQRTVKMSSLATRDSQGHNHNEWPFAGLNQGVEALNFNSHVLGVASLKMYLSLSLFLCISEACIWASKITSTN